MTQFDAPGWMEPDEVSLILARATGKRNALEIGTYCGRSTNALLRAVSGTVYTVDAYERGPLAHKDQRQYIHTLGELFPGRLVPIPCLSKELAGLWTIPVDVLMLDGAHDTETVLWELEELTPHLTPGGYLLLHDFNATSVDTAWARFPHDTYIPAGRQGLLQAFQAPAKCPEPKTSPTPHT